MAITGLPDGGVTHLGASMITGLITTTATAPVDVVKTNLMAGKQVLSCTNKPCKERA